MADERPAGEQLAEGTLISHLLELRSRLLRAVVAILIVSIPCMIYANELFTLVAQPLMQSLPKGATMISTSVIAPFITPFKLALWVAVFIAMPYVLYQIWSFVAPGLYRHERRFALPLLVSSVVLFYCGVTFAYFVVFPIMFKFFTATAPAGVQMMTDMTQYLDFVLVLFLVFGLCFEVPVAVVILVLLGVVSVEQLRQARPYVIIGAFVIAAVATPPDVLSQILLAVPMCLLYELGIVTARMLNRGEAARANPADAGR